MKKLFIILPILIVTSIYFSISNSSNDAHAFSNGGPSGYTGSPSDAKTCGTNGGCHNTSTAPFISDIIKSNIPSTGYIPGQTYVFTVNPKISAAPVSSKIGFSISPQTSTGTLLGTLVAGTNTKLNGTSMYLTHTGSGMNDTNRTFSWIAPTTAGIDSVIFYGSVIYTNGQNNTSGDDVITTRYVIKRDLINSINEVKSLFSRINVYSSNSSIILNLETENISKAAIQILDINGRNVTETKSFDLINGKNQLQVYLTNASKGVYTVSIITNNHLPITRKVLVD